MQVFATVWVAYYLFEGVWSGLSQNIKLGKCNTLKRYEITPCPSKFITPAPKECRQIQTERREKRRQEDISSKRQRGARLKWLND